MADVVVDDGWEAIERCYAEGWTDGLPVVPPTDRLVEAYLTDARWQGDEIIVSEPVRSIEIPAVKVVVNSIMAGSICHPAIKNDSGSILRWFD